MGFDSLLEWLAAHPEWILGTIALLSFLESVVLVGLVTPGITLLFLVASLAGTAQLPLWQVILTAGSAATAGDVLSFYLGRHWHAAIANVGLLRRHPQWLQRAETFVGRYGAAGVGVGRFIGPLRPILPMMAGTLEMPAWRFWLVELLTLPVWGALYMAPGHAVGQAADHALGAGPMAAIWAGLLVLGCLVAEAMLRSSRRARSPGTHSLAWLGVCASALLLIYLGVVTGFATDLDRWASIHWVMFRNQALDPWLVFFTALGEFTPMVLWAGTVTVALILQRCWGATALWILTTLAGRQLFASMKWLTDLERPVLVVLPPESGSFPSGHACMAILFTGTLTVLATPRLNAGMQRLAMYGCALWAVAHATTRLYLGVHWSSDVAAGLALGGMLVCLAHLARIHWQPRSPHPASLLVASILGIVMGGWFGVAPQFEALLAGYQRLGVGD